MSNQLEQTKQDHIPQVRDVKTHFLSGEPGTTGREPFEESSATGPGNNYLSTGSHQPHNEALHAAHGDQNNRGVDHLTAGSGLAAGGAGATGLAHNTHSSGLKGDHSHGHGISAESDARTAGTGGVAGDPVGSHFSNDKTTRHINENQADERNDRSLADKAKSAIGLGGSSNYAAADKDNRDVVDKINDVLPGTPAKKHDSSSTTTGTGHHTGSSATTGSTLGGHSASDAYGPGHTHADRDDVGTGIAYGAGKHGTDHYGPGHTGADNREIGIAGSGISGHKGEGRDHGDRVGALGQESRKYEGDLHSGPRTGGAAGTDRFDSDRTGVAGGVGSGLNRQHDDGVHHDTSQRAPGQSSGGIGGVLGTSDKDFTGRERQGKGAYADTDGKFELNKTGPAGNTALTGREGNLDNNPVREAGAHNAHATDSSSHSHTTGSNATAHDAAVAGEHTGEKKGFLAKVKDAIL
ncbi:uncharacterized protein MKK02DRAFT_29828 [Dioszegia hungarica]|uniref:Uncharacterized protein n=1 Tax=Dioszegia hungarica TaxID=4972 RepID=A0AA38HG68_9TREE|nr:uncharacterized protein MKK02DRAFT_29828 [Dioszegia hungarica]KAI9639862.1 hypothetical protein MKK02DRAFT_29828 [Dioszegia hungarica]